MKWLLGFVTGGWGWILTAGKWAVEHWKLVLSALLIAIVLSYTYVLGMRHKDSQWQKKWAARDAQEALLENEHLRVVKELDEIIDVEEAKSQTSKEARATENQEIDHEVAVYVAENSQPAVPGVCVDNGIDADGLRLIERQRAARLPGADQGH